MSVTTYIASIESSRNTIRNKLVEMGMAQSGDKLDKLATAIAGIIDQGAVSVNIKEGDTYTIPKGYHNGSGTVSGISGGGTYNLQSKIATPTKNQQNITPDSGYFGLSDVTITAIPEAYQDVSSVTATADDVLTGKIFVTADGTVTSGAMVNYGTVSKSLDVTTISYTIPKGYHSGYGKVQITLETKTVTPTKTQQKIAPTTGKVLSEVIVAPIPDEYITTGDATATSAHILSGKTAYVDGEKVTGTMTDNGAKTSTIDAGASYTIPAGYHNGSGTVTAKDLASQTAATATADHILSGDTAYVDGEKVTGTMTNNGAKTSTLNAGGSYTIPAGYHNGSGKITANSLSSQTAATAEASEILSGETAWVSGTKITGTMANNGEISDSIDGLNTNSVTIPAGYTTGGTVSLTNDIENALAAI